MAGKRSIYPGYSDAIQYLYSRGVEIHGRGGNPPTEAYVKRAYSEVYRAELRGERVPTREEIRGHSLKHIRERQIEKKIGPSSVRLKSGRTIQKKGYTRTITVPDQYSVGSRANPPSISSISRLARKVGKKDVYRGSITGIPAEGSGSDSEWKPGMTRTYSFAIDGNSLREALADPDIRTIEELAQAISPFGWTEVYSVNLLTD